MSTYPLNYGADDTSDAPPVDTQTAQAPKDGLDNELKAEEVTEDARPIGELPNGTERKSTPLYINWRLAKPSPKGGFIVQKVINTAPDGAEYTHWEQWRVEPGQDRPTWKLSYQPHDTFQKNPGALPGVRKVRSEARFYEDLPVNDKGNLAGFEAGKVPQAGALPATEIDPALPTANATEPFYRKWESAEY
jgi:hypothetical protein